MIAHLQTSDLDDPNNSDSFERWARETVRGRIQALALVMIGVFVFALIVEVALGNQQIQAANGAYWHMVLIAICSVCWMTMYRLPLARRYPVYVAAPLWFLVTTVAGLYLSSMGGFEGPFFYSIYAIAPLVVYLPCALPQRIVLTIGMGASFSVAFLAPHPEYWHYPLIHIPATYLVLGSAGSIALGHLGYKLICEHYTMRQVLSRKNETLVEQASAAVESLVLQLDTTRKAERTQIARILHDELGQLIVGARMKISNLERKFHKHGPEPSSSDLTSDLESLAGVMEELNESSRHFLRDLRTKDERPLQKRIGELIQSLAVHDALKVNLNLQLPTQPLPSNLEEIAYRTVQEALTNVLKHAGPCDVVVTLNVRDSGDTSEFVVTVHDTGSGFQPSGVPTGSWGLSGMRERVEEARGTLSVASDSEGTRISARLPLPQGAKP